MSSSPAPLRIALWCAVSSKPQAADDKTSLQAQEQAGRDFAAAVGGTVVATYTVPGHSRDYVLWSDVEGDIPAYRQLRRDAQAHAFDVLHATDPDRLGRHPALVHQVIGIVEASGAEVYLASAPHQIGQRSAGQNYLVAIQSVRAGEMQAIRVARHAHGMRARVLRGLNPGRVPYGYSAVRDALGHLKGLAQNEGAGAIRLMTALFLRGASYLAIAEALDDSPWRPPQAERWNSITVRLMLANDTYAGLLQWGQVRSPDPSPYIDAIWGPETHRRVLRERQRRARRTNKRPTMSPFQGVAYCARCRAPMWRYRTAKPYQNPGLRCSTHANKAKTGIECHPNHISDKSVWDVVLLTVAIAADRGGVANSSDNTADLRSQLSDLEAQLDAISERRVRLGHALASGAMDPAIYHQVDVDLLRDLEVAETKVVELQERIASRPTPQERQDAIEVLLAGLRELPRLPAPEANARLQNAGVRILIEDGQVVDLRM